MHIRADVNTPGLLEIGATTPGGGWQKEYIIGSANQLHGLATRHDWVLRPDAKKPIRGAEYSLRKAINDFNKLTATQQHPDLDSLTIDDISDYVVDGLDHTDYPDYVDAYVDSCKVGDVELSAEQLDYLHDNRHDLIYSLIYQRAVM